jgi:hypothetical protein
VRTMMILAAILVAALAVGALPIANETPITSDSGQAVPDGSLSVDLYADGVASVTFYDIEADTVYRSRVVALRENVARSFGFAGESWDSVYFDLDTATEVVPTWLAQ